MMYATPADGRSPLSGGTYLRQTSATVSVICSLKTPSGPAAANSSARRGEADARMSRIV